LGKPIAEKPFRRKEVGEKGKKRGGSIISKRNRMQMVGSPWGKGGESGG